MVDSVLAWLRQHDVKILNVAGPRESKRPGICRLMALDGSVHCLLGQP